MLYNDFFKLFNKPLYIAKLFALLMLTSCSVQPLYENAVAGTDDKHSTISVDVIANRDGQKLRLYLQNSLRDIQFTNKNLRLTVALQLIDKPFALDTDGYARRLLSTYNARVVLKDRDNSNNDNSIIMDKTISSSTTYNIAKAQGEVMLSLYGRNNSALLKELAHRIIENIRMVLEKRSEIMKK